MQPEAGRGRPALLLYALQIASANVKFTSFEPEQTQVIIDRECVARRPLGPPAWSNPAKSSGAPGVPARPEECLRRPADIRKAH